MTNPGEFEVKPITPDEVIPLKNKLIPDLVIEAWNEIIAEKYTSSGYANIKQGDIVTRIQTRMDCARQTVFDKHWLDVEDIYEEAGWDVKYDKPGWDETYEANFTFKRKRK